MRWQERFRRWLLDRWIVHVAILLWSAPAMYRALRECQTYLGRDKVLSACPACQHDLGRDMPWRNKTVAYVARVLWFARGKWDWS